MLQFYIYFVYIFLGSRCIPHIAGYAEGPRNPIVKKLRSSLAYPSATFHRNIKALRVERQNIKYFIPSGIPTAVVFTWALYDGCLR